MKTLTPFEIKVLRHVRGDPVRFEGVDVSVINAARMRLRAAGYLRFGQFELTPLATEVLKGR